MPMGYTLGYYSIETMTDEREGNNIPKYDIWQNRLPLYALIFPQNEKNKSIVD